MKKLHELEQNRTNLKANVERLDEEVMYLKNYNEEYRIKISQHMSCGCIFEPIDESMFSKYIYYNQTH